LASVSHKGRLFAAVSFAQFTIHNNDGSLSDQIYTADVMQMFQYIRCATIRRDNNSVASPSSEWTKTQAPTTALSIKSI